MVLWRRDRVDAIVGKDVRSKHDEGVFGVRSCSIVDENCLPEPDYLPNIVL